MYVSQIDVTGFRGVKEFEEPIELTDFTILVGRNNAGKSSILEALYACFGGRDPVLSSRRVERIRNIHDSSISYRYTGSGDVSIRGENARSLRTATDDGKLSDIALGDRELGPPRRKNDIESVVTDHLELPTETTTMLFSPSYESYTSILQQIKGMRDEVEIEGIHADVAEFISQQVDDEYTEVYLETLEARKRSNGSGPFFVDLADLGSGVLKTVVMYLAVETIEPAILVWDDMGTSLHPGLLNHVIEWLAEKDDLQVVASTHSIDALSTFVNADIENGSVVQVSKSADDVVSHTTLEMPELELVMNNAGLDPRFLSDEIDV